MFVPKAEKVTGTWRNEELRDLYCLPNIIIEMKSRIVVWAGL
jgi:hypothetical protein